MKRLFFLSVLAQKTIYLNGMSEFIKNKDEATEFAVITKNDKDSKYTVEFFSMDSTLIRSSQYSQFGKTSDKQVLHGKTQYKFARSQQDSIKRKDIYEVGIATVSSIYSEEGEFLGSSPFYVPPTPIDTDINVLIRELARKVELPIWKQAGVWEAYIEISFDSNGKLKGIRVIQNNHEGLVAPALKAATKVFQTRTFEPAIMDNDAVNGSIILPIRYKVERVR